MKALPIIIYLFLAFSDFGYAVAKHGQPRDAYNAWFNFLGMAISFFILWWGGFFNAILP